MELLTGYLYVITNKINGKSYVGQTLVTVHKRMYHHFSKYSNCKRLSSAIKSYGKENFQIKIVGILRDSSKERLKARIDDSEKMLIEMLSTQHPTGYNLTDGGSSSVRSKEATERIAQKHKKPVFCVETGQTWGSVMECADFFKVKPKQISKVLKGQRKRLKWAFTIQYLQQS